MPKFEHSGHKLAYDAYGSGERNVVLLPGLLLPGRMHEPLATALAESGNRVITFDPLGHGESDRPNAMWHYSMPTFAGQVLALLDHLDIEEAVVGGTSLGANVTLELASIAPERLRGMLIEMPVLDNALLACAIAFTPLLVALTFGEPVARPIAHALRHLPRVFGHYPNIGLDWMSQEPRPSAALMQGLFFGRTAPPRSERKTFDVPAIVIGHPRDVIHPFSDAQMLADELPNGHLIEANSIFELRLRPERLTREIASFIDGCWRPQEAEAAKPQRASAQESRRRASARER
jgi:pimeloyl-ACP methyl ester carboxylesterase